MFFSYAFFNPLQCFYTTVAPLIKPELSYEFITLILIAQKLTLYLFHHVQIWVTRVRCHYGGMFTFIEVCCSYNVQDYENFASQIFIYQSTHKTWLECFTVVDESPWNKIRHDQPFYMYLFSTIHGVIYKFSNLLSIPPFPLLLQKLHWQWQQNLRTLNKPKKNRIDVVWPNSFD